MTEPVVIHELDAKYLMKSIRDMKAFAEDHDVQLELLVLAEELEPLIYKAFFDGKFGELHTMKVFGGRLRTYIDGVRIRFSSKIDIYHPVMMFGQVKNVTADPLNPVCPPIGPGGSPGGGTPIAAPVARAA